MQTMKVKESSILVPSSNDICAILEGRKTQIRIIVKPQPEVNSICSKGQLCWHPNKIAYHCFDPNQPSAVNSCIPDTYCPYGKIGNKLWVRETWFPIKDPITGNERIVYKADSRDGRLNVKTWGGWASWKPSIFMPRSASRITLEITGLRVEQLQDISEEDAIAEGARRFDDLPSIHPFGQDPRWSMEESPPSTDYCLNSARLAFANYWNKLNADRGYSWDSNPFV